MSARQVTVLVAALLLSGVLGFVTSRRGGIQPGYFEKQEAPAYGVAKDRPMGSELGKDYEEHFKRLYDQK
jgi:hypothetical protein